MSFTGLTCIPGHNIKLYKVFRIESLTIELSKNTFIYYGMHKHY